MEHRLRKTRAGTEVTGEHTMDTLAQKIPAIATSEASAPAARPSARREVSADDAEAFRRRLQGDDVPAPQSPRAVEDGGSERNATLPLGDAILNGLKHAGVEFENQWNGLKDTVSAPGPLTVAQSLRLQMQMFELEHQAQFTATVIKKTSTAIDQAIHTQ
jgi:hypothetical protein